MGINNIVRKGVNLLKQAARANSEEIAHGGINYYSSAEVEAKFKHFQIQTVSILIDGSTDLSTISQINGVAIAGYYSFNLDVIGS